MNGRDLVGLALAPFFLGTLGCSAAGDGASPDGESQQEERAPATGGSAAEEEGPIVVMNAGGAPAEEEVTHPLFGAGSYAGVDTSDPCNTAPLWKPNTSVPHETGTIVLYEGSLWEITGVLNDPEASWVRSDCMPPGNPENPADCGAEYLWEHVGVCE